LKTGMERRLIPWRMAPAAHTQRALAPWPWLQLAVMNVLLLALAGWKAGASARCTNGTR
jgi:hypothetical protein